ncbi:MAG: 6-bladed beta-propeller [Bacteroidales bacterium]|jgi:hypothetical protein|nr:6-bladed beta-propeller [Bacteroidales bacterium]
MKNLFKILLYILLLSGCTSEKNEHKGVIDIVSGIKRNIKMPLSDITNDIAFIPLETKDECIIGKIRLLSFFADYVIVIDDLPQILLFDKMGEYVRQIGSEGEFFSIYASVIVNNELFIWDIHLNSTLCYDLNTGKCIRTKKHDFLPSDVKHFKDSLLVYYSSISLHDRKIPFYCIHTLSLDFSKTDSLWINREYQFVKNIYIDEGKVNTYLMNGNMYIWDSNIDTVFYLNNNFKREPGYQFFLGKYTLSENNRYNSHYINHMKDNEFMITRIMETNRFFFIEGLFGRYHARNILYDKTTKKSRNIIFNLDLHDAGFHNDIDGSIPFWPKGQVSQNVLYDYISPYELKKLMEDPYYKTIKFRDKEQNERIKNWLSSAKITDNPIIVLATIKNE